MEFEGFNIGFERLKFGRVEKETIYSVWDLGEFQNKI